MNPILSTDPTGRYTTSEATVMLDGSSLSAGDGTSGDFVVIESDGTKFTYQTGTDGEKTRSKNKNPNREMSITLPRSSPSNAALRKINDQRRPLRITVSRLDGTTILDAEVVQVRAGSPHDVGRGACRWDLTVSGGA